jgi:hypothetical protein
MKRGADVTDAKSNDRSSHLDQLKRCTIPADPTANADAARIAYLSVRPSFSDLADKYSYLNPHVSHHGTNAKLDFTSWHATHALTQALFEDGFGVLGWDIPEGRLIPALTNRMNYLMWLADLLTMSYSGMLPSLCFILPLCCDWQT